MNTLWFLADWALRGAALATAAAIVIGLLRVRDASTRLAACVALLLATLAVPLLLPVVPPMFHAVPAHLGVTVLAPLPPNTHIAAPVAEARPFDREQVALALYAGIAILLAARIGIGLFFTRGLVRRAEATEYPGVFSSRAITVPVTIGILRPVILLPAEWRDWDDATIAAVLEHEQSHVRRHDPAVQLLSALHRAILWFSPVSWLLHSAIARLAEDASDDRALAATRDAAHYAETLLAFARRAPRRMAWTAVAMARAGGTERRIDRVLSGHSPSTGLRRAALLAVVLIAAPAVYVVAAAQQAPPPPPPPPPHSAARPPAPAVPPVPPQPAPPAPPAAVGGEDAFAVVSPEHQTYSGHIDRKTMKALLSEGGHSVWFERGGKQYVITDKAMVARAVELFAKQSALGEAQGKLGEQQGELGEKQGELGEKLGEFSARLAELTEQLASREAAGMKEELERANKELAKQQEAFAKEQASFAKQQEAFSKQQEELGKQQQALGEQQERESRRAAEGMRRLIDEALKKGLAQPRP